MNFKIEKGIEIPARKWGKKGIEFPFSKMDVGDSFFTDKKYHVVVASKCSNKLGMKFMSRAVDGGFRIWRVQ